ncbi:alpha/beta hydrolase [Pigmentiphaga litoralis]|uniref:alpha/beta fold hydrolase n=1 Tax=Pigmentiphaga litoralis TaxID=516702 RepID=UPI00167A5E16|nr:alpha/beta hydrolase [Pigmentiphaga litoralis]GGX17236.1 alpha/beta hydrolase [Pigmentiphaga litoralis]
MTPVLWFVHGWGFDAGVFDALADRLEPISRSTSQSVSQPISQLRYDAGYVGSALLQPPIEPFIAVAHSFGMMRVLKNLAPHCMGIVCLNGFARFSAAPDFAAGTPLRLIDRMLQRLRQDPMGVVNTFRARCGAAPYPATTGLDVDALFADLSALRDDDVRAALAACPVPIVAVAADDDPIVSPAMTAMTFATRSSTPPVMLAEGGHLLPVTHPAECADAVRRVIQLLQAPPNVSLTGSGS